MRICFDSHMVGGQETGNETYALGLVAALSERSDLECVATLMPNTPIPTEWAFNQPEVVPIKPSNNWLRLAYTLPAICRKHQVDLLHVTYNAPFINTVPFVVSVHDVIFQHYPEFFSHRDRLLFATLLPYTMRRSKAIITLSETSKVDIERFYPWTRGKTHVVPVAADPQFQPIHDAKKRQIILDKYGLKQDFLLAVGNLQPRKNLARLVEALRLLLKSGIQDVQLVLVGKEALHFAEFRASIQDLLDAGIVRCIGYVPKEDLPTLYSLAKVFIYPSLYEGFGLPILEAMACGTPVITSNTSSMPEVAGDAAILVDPYQAEQFAQAIAKLVSDAAMHAEYKLRGLRQAAQFTWQACAKQTVEVYRHVLESQTPKGKQ